MKIPWYSVVFTALILYVAATQLNWTLLLATFSSANPTLIGFALVCWATLMIFKSLKWKQIVAAADGVISLGESARILFIGLFISVITPGRAGDFVRAVYVKDRIPIGKGILAVLIDRIIDIVSLLIFAGIGVVLLANTKVSGVLSVPVIVVLIFAFVILVTMALNRKFARHVGWPLLKRFLPERFKTVFRKYGNEFYDALPGFAKHIPNILIAIFCSTVSWVLSVTFGWFIMQALGLDIPWTGALAVVPILALVEIIPVGILGIGTREIAAALILSTFGIAPETAVAYSLTYFALGYIPSFVLGAIFFLRHPLPIEGGLKGLLKKGFG